MEFKAKKSLGQNFLIDKNIIKKIIAHSKITKYDTVLEVGPGTGQNIDHYYKNTNSICLFEPDKKLFEQIKKKYPIIQISNFLIMNF